MNDMKPASHANLSRWTRILVFFAWAAVSAPSLAQDTPDSETLLDKARTFARHFVDKKFDAMQPMMDATMKRAFAPAAAAQQHSILVQRAGEFEAFGDARRADDSGYRIVLVGMTFANAAFDAKVVFDRNALVAGFFFVPASAMESKKPPYADEARFREEKTRVSTGQYELPGVLTIPVGIQAPPVAVFVHGSGPSDRDATLGPNKPFRDIAWGLANRGIASLRYDKRTLVYRDTIAAEKITPREETIEDALSAIRLVASDDRFDGDRIALIGHSLGGLLGPKIASESRRLDGLVIMAGSNRPFLVMMKEQYQHIFMEDGRIEPSEQAMLDELFAAARKIRAGESPAGMLGGAGVDYFKWLDEYKPLETAKRLPMPILVAQGERDYQVLAAKDYANWKAALGDADNVTWKLYPDLDHLFMSGSGRSFPKDYEKPRNVSEKFIKDIAVWMKSLKQ